SLAHPQRLEQGALALLDEPDREVAGQPEVDDGAARRDAERVGVGADALAGILGVGGAGREQGGEQGGGDESRHSGSRVEEGQAVTTITSGGVIDAKTE